MAQEPKRRCVVIALRRCRALRGGALALITAALAAGCVTGRHAPTAEERGRVKAVEVESIAAGTVVQHLASRNLDGAERDAAKVERPRVELGLETERVLAFAVVDAGRCETALPHRRRGEPGDRGAIARLEVKLLSATLAAGPGADPLAVLWLRFRTRVAVPQSSDTGELVRRWLGPAFVFAADPRPRPTSEWMARDGAEVREAVAAISARVAPQLVADLRNGEPQVACSRNEGAVASARDGAPAPAVAPPGTSAGVPVQVRVEFLSEAPSEGNALKALGALGGVVVGGVAGAFYGLGKCAEGVGGGGGGGNEIVAAIVVACAMVAMPVGAVVGMPLGGVKGASLAAAHVERERAARNAERDRNVTAMEAAGRSSGFSAAVARVSQSLVSAAPIVEGQPAVLGEMVVRLDEQRGTPPLSELELDLTLRSAGEQEGRERRLCLRGPGPVPTELWLRQETGLLRGAVEAMLARAIALGSLGLEPQRGDGPCRAEVKPPPAQPSGRL